MSGATDDRHVCEREGGAIGGQPRVGGKNEFWGKWDLRSEGARPPKLPSFLGIPYYHSLWIPIILLFDFCVRSGTR